jgi:hypothetical protein
MTVSTWDGWPARVSQDYFQQSMEQHAKVRRVEKQSPSRWDLILTNGRKIQVFITDVYTFSASDYALLRGRYPEVECIVSASNWNHFSDQAEEDAANDGVVTVHLGGELMSTVHDYAKDRGSNR